MPELNRDFASLSQVSMQRMIPTTRTLVSLVVEGIQVTERKKERILSIYIYASYKIVWRIKDSLRLSWQCPLSGTAQAAFAWRKPFLPLLLMLNFVKKTNSVTLYFRVVLRFENGKVFRLFWNHNARAIFALFHCLKYSLLSKMMIWP